ncbi:MAG: hypothetical protein AAGA08_16825 [Pseudomonadota bacterium]
MTDMTEPRLDFWGRAQIAARWMRDQFAAVFITGWLYVIGWGIILTAFGGLLYLDAHFSYNLAVGSSITPLVFMVMGAAFRFFAATFLMASERSRQKGLGDGKVWRRLGIAVSLLVCLHAIGIGLEALDSRRDTALAAQDIAEASVAGADEVIERLEGQKVSIRDDLVTRLEPINTEINNLDTDGLSASDARSDALRVRRTELEDAAQGKIDAIDAQILELTVGGADRQIEVIEAEASANPWAPLFVGLAQLVTWSQTPSDWSVYLVAVGFIVFWVFIAESIVIFGPKELYKMHLHDAEMAMLRTGEGATVTISEDEYAALKEREQNAKAGGRKAARTRRVGTKKIEAARYYEQLAKTLVEAKRARPSLVMGGMVGVKKYETTGMTVSQLDMVLRTCVEHGFMSREDYDFVTGTPAVNGHDPKDDFTPPNEGDGDADDISRDQPDP